MSVKKVIIALIIVAVVGTAVVFSLSNKKEDSIYTTAVVAKGAIKQTVSESGTVKADTGIDLGFLNTGKLSKLFFKVGDKINEGDVLAELDYSELLIKKEEAGANLDVAKGNLNKLLSGATIEEISVSKAGVEQAYRAYESVKNELTKTKESVELSVTQAEKTLKDLESKSDLDITPVEQAVEIARTSYENTKKTYQNSVDNYLSSALILSEDKISVMNNVLDVLFVLIDDEDLDSNLSVKNRIYLENTVSDYNRARELLSSANNSLLIAKKDSSNGNVKKLVSDTFLALSKTFDALRNCYMALENSITSSSFTSAELDATKTDIGNQQTITSAAISSIQSIEQSLSGAILAYDNNVSSAEANLTNAEAAYSDALTKARNNYSSLKISSEQQIVSAESRVNNAFEAWQLSQAQFESLTAKASQYDISLSQAKIRQAEASLNAIKRQVENSIIVSPLGGVITKINFDLGEQVSVNMPVISIITEKKFNIDVMITEVDIAKIKNEDKAQVTLDSFGEDVKFYGTVEFVDPAETIIDGVIYYKTVIGFDYDGREIKSGMTANVAITTDERENALMLPIRGIVDRGLDGKFARILKDGILKEEKVELGLYGDGGMVEVLSGVSEGDLVVTYINE